MNPLAWLALPLLSTPALAACTPAQDPSPVEPSLQLVDAFPEQEFREPLFLTYPEDGTQRLFVIEKKGRIRVFDQAQPKRPSQLFLDWSDKVSTKGNEEGLLGLAFHPNYAENGYFYVHYSSSVDDQVGYVSRFQVSEDDPDQANPESEVVLLRQPQPWRNHNGGMIAFGPDGYLYISFGDGGAGGDPKNSGQDLSTWLGAILRIDVDKAGEDRPYSIPSDNPFVDREGAAPEIYAYGLRNVWRFSFDRETGALWGGDVGQNLWEEIDIIEKGGNYGWNHFEGFSDFARKVGKDPLPAAQHKPPVAVYGRREGVSVTGGYVYRGKRHPSLVGDYLYGDYRTGNVWRLRQGEDGQWKNVIALQPRRSPLITSFAEDREGEVYLLSQQGKIWRVDLAEAASKE